MTHNLVYLFPATNLGNYQVDMTISPLAQPIKRLEIFSINNKGNYSPN